MFRKKDSSDDSVTVMSSGKGKKVSHRDSERKKTTFMKGKKNLRTHQAKLAAMKDHRLKKYMNGLNGLELEKKHRHNSIYMPDEFFNFMVDSFVKLHMFQIFSQRESTSKLFTVKESGNKLVYDGKEFGFEDLFINDITADVKKSVEVPDFFKKHDNWLRSYRVYFPGSELKNPILWKFEHPNKNEEVSVLDNLKEERKKGICCSLSQSFFFIKDLYENNKEVKDLNHNKAKFASAIAKKLPTVTNDMAKIFYDTVVYEELSKINVAKNKTESKCNSEGDPVSSVDVSRNEKRKKKESYSKQTYYPAWDNESGDVDDESEDNVPISSSIDDEEDSGNISDVSFVNDEAVPREKSTMKGWKQISTTSFSKESFFDHNEAPKRKSKRLLSESSFVKRRKEGNENKSIVTEQESVICSETFEDCDNNRIPIFDASNDDTALVFGGIVSLGSSTNHCCYVGIILGKSEKMFVIGIDSISDNRSISTGLVQMLSALTIPPQKFCLHKNGKDFDINNYDEDTFIDISTTASVLNDDFKISPTHRTSPVSTSN